MMDGMTRVFAARHGETDWNREGRWQGHSGPGLNDMGRSQAAALAERLAAMGLDVIYTSDLPRALQTAEVVAKRLGVAMEADPAFREVDVGDWAGLTRDVVAARDPEGYTRWLGGRAGWNGGETYEDMHTRVIAAYERVCALNPDARVLIVAHGGTVRALAAYAVGLEHHDRRRIDGVRNASLTALDHVGAASRLLKFNDDGHLPPADR
jgi:2,3-bisphosphoglycerate-dependent phosphoglycerate mutase